MYLCTISSTGENLHIPNVSCLHFLLSSNDLVSFRRGLSLAAACPLGSIQSTKCDGFQGAHLNVPQVLLSTASIPYYGFDIVGPCMLSKLYGGFSKVSIKFPQQTRIKNPGNVESHYTTYSLIRRLAVQYPVVAPANVFKKVLKNPY